MNRFHRTQFLAVSGITLLMAAAFASPAAGATYRVSLSGSDVSGCGTETTPCATIQQAVNQAVSGDTILVSQGTYVDSEDCDGESSVVCVRTKQLTILGGFAGGNWSLPDPVANLTIIDGQNTRRGVIVRGFSGPTSLRMEGFTITNCRATGPGNVVGGGLKSNYSDITLRDMVLDGNVVVGGVGLKGIGGGGGVSIQSDTDSLKSIAVLERVTFRDNQVTGGTGTNGAGIGGGLLVDFAVVTGQQLIFQNNSVVGGGSSASPPGVNDGLGGGMAFSFGTDATIVGLTATGNTSTGGSTGTVGGSFGGAVYMEGNTATEERTTAVITDAVITGNTSTGGSGASPGGGVGGGVMVFRAQLTLERSTVIGNQAIGGSSGTANAGGGGVFLQWPVTSTPPINVIRNSIVADNVITGSQGGGGGVRLLAAVATVEHTTVVDNRIVGAGFGSGILVGPQFSIFRPSELTLSYSIVADHTVPSGARALHVQASTTFTQSEADLSAGNLFVGNSNDTNEGESGSGTFVGTGSPPNIYDPNPTTFFIDPAGGDYHVDGTSPPTNSATASTEPLDVDGASRSGTRDLGADEFGALAFALTVGKVGVGSGTVTSSPSGINCGSDCYEIYGNGTNVTLTPTPDPGFYFTGWTGDADCVGGVILMTADNSCTAQFEDEPPPPPPECTVENDTLNLTGSESGSPNWQACVSITAENYTITDTGDVRFEAPLIILRNGFEVQSGGTFTAASVLP